MTALHTSTHPSIKQASANPEKTTKATLRVALVTFPVLAAFTLGFALITFMVASKPAEVSTANKASAETENHANVNPPLSPIFTKEVLSWTASIQNWADKFNLDPNLVATVMQIESCGLPDAQSSSGALGLFQVMPFHFSETDDPLDPDTNASRGLTYFTRALELSGGNPSLAMAGYNGGHSVIGLSSSQWAEETRRYVYWAAGIVDDVRRGVTESGILKEWLASGGESLCRQASVVLGLE